MKKLILLVTSFFIQSCDVENSKKYQDLKDENLNNSFVVYPNPSTKGVFTIKNHTKEIWEVYNLNGAKVLSGKEEIIDVSKFSKGIYILKHNNSYKKLLYN